MAVTAVCAKAVDEASSTTAMAADEVRMFFMFVFSAGGVTFAVTTA